MAEKDHTDSELLRRFADVTSGDELLELRELFEQVDMFGDMAGQLEWGPLRPDLRRPPLQDLHSYRIRLELVGSDPTSWRLLEVRSDARLEWLHEYIQIVFDWDGSYGHRFSLGGDPFDDSSQLFVSEEDDEACAELTAGNVQEFRVRLDETLQRPGDTLHYAYHLPDGPALLITLEEAVPASSVPQPVRLLQGSGPGRIDVMSINRELEGPCAGGPKPEIVIPARLIEMNAVLSGTAAGDGYQRRLGALLEDERSLSHGELIAALSAFRWFLDRASDGGIELTSSGYLKPRDVEAACGVVPRHWSGYGKNNRESNAPEVRHFRESLQKVGLLRKHKGSLVLTRAGTTSRSDPWELWHHLTTRLVPDADGFEKDAALVFLLHAATADGRNVSLGEVAEELTLVGWRAGDQPISRADFRMLPPLAILGNLTAEPDVSLGMGLNVSFVASILAREALLGWSDRAR